MLVVFPVCHKDFAQATELLQWIADLGSNERHEFLIVASRTVEMEQISDLHKVASKSFAGGQAIRLQREEEKGWPVACNAMFKTAAEWVEKNGNNGTTGHWLWVEPDCAPLASGWLDLLEEEYRRIGKAFMGTVYDGPGTVRHLNGVAVYPKHVRRYNPAMLFPGHLPFDCARPELTLRVAHQTKLIQRSLKDNAKNEAHTFSTADELTRVIKPETILFHGCKDNSLIARLRERHGSLTLSTLTPPSTPTNLTKAKNRIVTVAKRMARVVTGQQTYYHSGNLGDIIYGLYAIKLAGGGDLIIGPERRETAPCSNPVSREQFELLRPLLEKQPYLKKVEWRANHPGSEAIDMNRFRDLWYDDGLRVRTGINTLAKMQCHLLGVAERFREDETWLETGGALWTDAVVVNRTARHLNASNGHGSAEFPWLELVSKYRDKMLFVGLQKECEKFRKDFGRVAFYECRDFLDMARVIEGGCCAVMNQSFPLSLAIGLGQKVLCEGWRQSPDCVFEREGMMQV